MANMIESEPCAGGIRITRLVSTDRDIVIPESIDGSAVVAIGPFFLSGSPASDGRTVTVPGTVVEIDRDAFGGIIGIREIAYGGTMEAFCSLGLDAEFDVEVSTADGHRFGFLSGYPMRFPAFDEAIQAMNFKMTQELAVSRLRDPVLLTPECRERYRRYLSSRIMPRAEQAVTSGDTSRLAELLSTGMFDDASVRTLMERSLRSGKTAVTSMLMSELYSRRNGEKGA